MKIDVMQNWAMTQKLEDVYNVNLFFLTRSVAQGCKYSLVYAFELGS